MRFEPSELRNSFGSAIFDFSLPTRSLIDVQKLSYDSFLYGSEHGIMSIDSVLKSTFPVHDSFGCATMDCVGYRIAEPKFDALECQRKSLTYSADIYIKLVLSVFQINQETGVRELRSIKEQETILCSIPMMTKNATFVINGFERIIVSQIHRSPGVFFAKESDANDTIYSASIISYRGSWLEMLFDAKNNLYFRIDKKRKINIYHLLHALKMTDREIIEYFYTSLSIKYDSSKELWNLALNPNAMVGQILKFDLLNSNGDLMFNKGSMVVPTMVEKLSIKNDIWCSTASLVGCILANSVKINGDIIWDIGTVLNENILGLLLENNIFSIEIIDNNLCAYNASIVQGMIEHKSSYAQSMEIIFKVIRSGDPFVLEEAEKYFQSMFFSANSYNLSAVGRFKLNKAVREDDSIKDTILHIEDILLVVKKLIMLKENGLDADDIDSLSNRRVRSVGELLENQFRVGLSRVLRGVVEKFNSTQLDNLLPSDAIVNASLVKVIKDFFLSSQLSQFMDQTNPLSELAHKRRISSLGVGGLSRDRAGIDVRDVHPTHYGRICPIETPEGQNIGLINSLATYAIVDKYGFIRTPYRKVIDHAITDDIVLMDSDEEGKYVIAQANTHLISGRKIVKDLVSARKNGESIMAHASDIQMIDVSPKQAISVVASLIPFLENDDAKRALMGSNMQRQAVPLIVTEAPLIGTGIEREINTSSSVLVKAIHRGIVASVEAGSVTVVSLDNENNKTLDVQIYTMKKFIRSNNNTCINQIPIVSVGDILEVDDLIADGQATSYGEIALGRNLLVAFMPWNGYNFEDSIVISERVVSEDLFSSIHIESFEVIVRDTRLGAEKITRDLPNSTEEEIKNLDENGIVNVGAYVISGDVLVGKVTPQIEAPITPEERLLRAIFGDNIADVSESSLKVPSGLSGTVIDVQILTRRGNKKSPRAEYIQEEELQHLGNIKDQELSILKDIIVEKIDCLIKGSTVKIKGSNVSINDDNIATLSFEEKIAIKASDPAITAQISDIAMQYNDKVTLMNDKYNVQVSKMMDGETLQAGVLEIIRVFVAVRSKLQPGDKMAGRHGNKGIVSKIMPLEDMPFMEDGTPVDIVLNPLGVPGRINIGQIMETHLGFASYVMGKTIKEMLSKKSNISDIRAYLSDVLPDKRIVEKLDAMSDDDFMRTARFYSNGVPFAVPVFEGARVNDIENILSKVGVNPSGQVTLYDGQTGQSFDRQITIGYMYMMKLHHLADNKIHARSTGPYSLVTQQPLGGKSHFGGQRFGEMECWALQAYGAAFTLQEMLTVKSDDVDGRTRMYESIVKGEITFDCGSPESFNVLFKELKALCFNIQLHNN